MIAGTSTCSYVPELQLAVAHCTLIGPFSSSLWTKIVGCCSSAVLCGGRDRWFCLWVDEVHNRPCCRPCWHLTSHTIAGWDACVHEVTSGYSLKFIIFAMMHFDVVKPSDFSPILVGYNPILETRIHCCKKLCMQVAAPSPPA